MLFFGVTFRGETPLIYRLFLVRAILEEQGGADRRKGTGNYIPKRSEADHRIRAVTGAEYFDSLGKKILPE
jgi:hypothetical protein